MKKLGFVIGTIIFCSPFWGFYSNKAAKIVQVNHSQMNYTTGSPGGKTGAPGDGICTTCHTGTVQNGTTMNSIVVSDISGPVNNYVPNETYTVTVSMNTANPKNGFEIVALRPTNAQAGTFFVTDATNTKSITSGGKGRITHTAAGTANTSWTFEWMAPSTNVGNVTFYLATNLTNSNSNTGDVIYKSQYSLGSTAGLDDVTDIIDLRSFYNPSNNSINLTMNTQEKGTVAFNLVDINGKSVQFERLGSNTDVKSTYTIPLKDIGSGVYFIHFSVDNYMVTKKIYIY